MDFTKATSHITFRDNRINRGTYIVREGPDPLNSYRVVYVIGHGRVVHRQTTDLMTVDDIVAVWDSLEAELRKDIGGEDVHPAPAPVSESTVSG